MTIAIPSLGATCHSLNGWWSLTKKTKKVRTVFYKHTKTVTTTKKVKKTKKEYQYSKRKPVIEDVKWYLPDKVYVL